MSSQLTAHRDAFPINYRTQRTSSPLGYSSRVPCALLCSQIQRAPFPVRISYPVSVLTATEILLRHRFSPIGSLYLVIRPSPSSQNLTISPGYILLCLVSAIVSGNHTNITHYQTGTTLFGLTARYPPHTHPQPSTSRNFRAGNENTAPPLFNWISIPKRRPPVDCDSSCTTRTPPSNRSYTDNANCLPVTNHQRQSIGVLLLGSKDLIFCKLEGASEAPTPSATQSQPGTFLF